MKNEYRELLKRLLTDIRFRDFQVHLDPDVLDEATDLFEDFEIDEAVAERMEQTRLTEDFDGDE
jgi:hypothetical protein